MDLRLTINSHYCEHCGKVPYHSREEAEKDARALHRSYGRRLAYYSDECGCWHLTSGGKR